MNKESVALKTLETEFKRLLSAEKVAWLKSIRSAAFQRFESEGFPTRRSEDWRYINLSPLKEKAYTSVHSFQSEVQLPEDLEFEGYCRIVFVNGQLSPKHTRLSTGGTGVRVRSFRDVLRDEGPRFELLLKTPSQFGHDPMSSLGEAFFTNGAIIEIEGSNDSSPVVIVNVHEGQNTFSATRNIILVSEGAAGTVAEIHWGPEGSASWSNTITDLSLSARSRFTYYKIEIEGESSYHIGHTRIHQTPGSALESYSISMGAKISRHNLLALLEGQGSSVHLNGLYLAREGQHQDHFTLVDHRTPEGESHQFYKGVLSEKSHGVFNGKILVRKDAQKTNSSQLNRNLLLGKMAEIDTRPQLEIHADDVKANHGASIGRLNREELFYLESRGISRSKAVDLLCRGFAEEILLKMPHSEFRELCDAFLNKAYSKMKVGAL